MTAFVNPDLSIAQEIDMLGATPRKRKRGAPERQAQVAVVKFLKTALPPGSIVAAIKNEHGAAGATKVQRMRFGAKRKAEGVAPGFPDLICLLPNPPRVLLIEMKAPKGVLSDAQLDMHAHLASIGFSVVVCRDVLGAAAALKAAGITLRRSRLDGAA